MPKQKKTDHERIMTRVSRIEGRLRGVRRMIEGEDECLSIIVQISAVRQALATLGVELLEFELLKNDIACKLDGKQKIGEAYLKSLGCSEDKSIAQNLYESSRNRSRTIVRRTKNSPYRSGDL
ncbi:MAG: metal-sensitive transcriptional regulator [Candidatus Moranbacteria bacterium]|nr:metal-sensitive transcriptional regulator [Candidatus Moranbacteria bacterium]